MTCRDPLRQKREVAIYGTQIKAISDIFRTLNVQELKDLVGVQAFNSAVKGIATLETSIYNSGKPMHEQGRPATSKYTLPLEAP